MRKIRNSAIASAAAVSLIFGASTIAVAEEKAENTVSVPNNEEAPGTIEGDNGNKLPKGEDNAREELPCRYDLKDKDGRYLDSRIEDAIIKHNDPNCVSPSVTDVVKQTVKTRSSSGFGNALNADVPVSGKDLLGKHVNSSRQPAWSQVWIVAAALGVIGTVIGLGILPVLNDMRAKGIIL